jgi:uncharacterized protein
VHLAIPIGTKVLTRSDKRVGLIVSTPSSTEQPYRVRFADGTEESHRRVDLSIYKHEQNAVPDGPNQTDLLPFVVYRCVVGSTAYKLSGPNSDIDRRGFYLPPANLHWSLAGVPEQLETDNEEVYWEIEKFIRLALKANPNVLETLYSPLVETSKPIALQLLQMRHIFLSQYVHRTYNSYVLSQFKKIEQDLRNAGQVRWKHVMHLIRLLISGITILREGFVPLVVEPHRDQLLSIRKGEVEWEEIEKWRLSLHKDLDHALQETTLPPHPDYAAANSFLISARRFAASEKYEQD